MREKGLVFARDRLGVKPLYFSLEDGVIGVASEIKALHEIGFSRMENLIPGSLCEASLSKYWLTPPPDFPTEALGVDLGDAVAEVTKLLSQSVQRRVDGRRVAISFSGGLDSSIIASLASKFTEVKLITAAVPGSRDQAEASEAAAKLDLPLHTVEISEDEVSQQLLKIQWLIETQNPMDAAIAVALHYSARRASELKCDTLLLGQLADELFGGYAKYLQMYRDVGEDATGRAMLQDVKLAYKMNFERDDKATSPFARNSVPYASLPLVKYVIRLPLKFKIEKEKGVRKLLLRKVGENLGIPAEIVQKPKKAIQYSSGAQKIVNKLLG